MTASLTPDWTAAQAAVIAVSHFIDRKQWDELRQLFDSSVRTDYTSLFGGAVVEQSGEALVAAWRTLLTPIVTQHLLGPIALTVEATAAIAQCHVRGYHYAKDTAGGDEWMVAGHYTFAMAPRGRAWKIRELKLQTFYQTGNLNLLELAGGR